MEKVSISKFREAPYRGFGGKGKNIAYQLPMFGGNAVYQARAILGLEVMDDYNNLRIHTPIIASSITTNTNVFYPNPTRGDIMINHKCENNCYVEIYDLTGRLVLKQILDGKLLSVKTIPSGSYVFKLKSGNVLISEELVNIIK
jgi:hypothetical protein